MYIYNSCIFTVLRSYLDVLYVYLYHFIGALFFSFPLFSPPLCSQSFSKLCKTE